MNAVFKRHIPLKNCLRCYEFPAKLQFIRDTGDPIEYRPSNRLRSGSNPTHSHSFMSLTFRSRYLRLVLFTRFALPVIFSPGYTTGNHALLTRIIAESV